MEITVGEALTEAKTCTICKTEKPTTEFYKSPGYKDGIRSQCRACMLEYKKRYKKTLQGKIVEKRYKQSSRGKETDRRYKKSIKGKVSNKKYKQSKKGQESYRKQIQQNPKRHKARWAVNNAVRDGKLPRANTLSCLICKSQAEHYHHHKGYSKKCWLEVIPLCAKCHNNIHSR